MIFQSVDHHDIPRERNGPQALFGDYREKYRENRKPNVRSQYMMRRWVRFWQSTILQGKQNIAVTEARKLVKSNHMNKSTFFSDFVGSLWFYLPLLTWLPPTAGSRWRPIPVLSGGVCRGFPRLMYRLQDQGSGDSVGGSGSLVQSD